MFPEKRYTYSSHSAIQYYPNSIHGLRYIVAGDTAFERLVWLAVVVVQFSVAFYLISDVMIAWEANPVVTATDLVPAEEIEFPAITICPQG